ncbi:MAG: flavodoxin family protein [Desulfobacterales bacterium]|nr:flavodoxin family protein [Desulfobacterales bacterium]
MINGSPRKDGNTASLLAIVGDELKREGIGVESIHLGGAPLAGCRACDGCGSLGNGRCVMDDDGFNTIFAKMVEADGIVLGSPTYFADVTAEMKAFIDRAGYASLSNGGLLRRKVGAAVVSQFRSGSVHAFDTMNHLFTYSEMVVVGSNNWNMGLGYEKGDVKNDESGLKTMRILGANMAWAMKRLCS